jgi:tetratricopeptide (TPR) repeat protein
VRAFNRALEIHPAYGAAAYNLGNLHAHANRLGEAVAAYQRALEHSPMLVQAWYNLALVRRMQNRPEDALEAFRRAAELAPSDPVSQQSLADTLLGMGRNEQAVAAYDRALAAGAAPQNTRLNRGVARQRAYGCESALQDYLTVLHDNPGNPTARSNAVACLQQTGRHEEARQIAAEGSLPATRRHVANPETGR